MTKLTNQMFDALKIIYETNSIDKINNQTIKALTDRGLIIDKKLSEDGRVLAISKMRLSKQCTELSLNLIEIYMNYKNTSPELAALKYFEKQGYIGSTLEGNFILIILKALMLDKLEEYNTFKDRKDARLRALSAQFVINQNNINDIISSIKIVTRKQFISNISEIINEPLIQEFLPCISLDTTIAFFDAVDLAVFEKIAIKFAESPYDYSKGWPDLTIIKDKEVRLIEVKTTDKLHASQLKIIPELKKILPFEISICKISNLEGLKKI